VRALDKFLLHFFLLALIDSTWSQVFIWLSVPDEVVELLRLALSKEPNRIGVSPHLKTETDPVSEMSCLFFFLVTIKNPHDGQSSKPQQFCVLYTIVRTL
jgi:hypothetical protein